MVLEAVRWGMIGCGDVAEVKGGPAFQKAERSSLVAVMRRDRGKAEDYAHRHGVPKVYADAARLIADPEIDAICIATPPSSHLEYAVMAARAGKPVYVEKPMARTHGECQEMIAACAGVPLFVAHYRRALPRFVKVKELVDSGAIGTPRVVTVTLRQPPDPAHADRAHPPWRVVPAIAGGGLFVDLASHTLDLLDYFLGPVARVAGGAANQGHFYDAEDLVTAQLEFASGVHGVGAWCFTSGDEVDRAEIVGSRGAITFATFGDAPVVLSARGEVSSFAIPHPRHVQQPLIQTVVDELGGRGKCPSTGVSAARTCWVMDEALRRYRSA
jgi:1,5-anhydro-D-fructose reductase (1,5-anhydro-D-mannitol-forming)